MLIENGQYAEVDAARSCKSGFPPAHGCPGNPQDVGKILLCESFEREMESWSSAFFSRRYRLTLRRTSPVFAVLVNLVNQGGA